MDRVVLCFRWRGPLDREAATEGVRFEQATEALLQRCAVLGGRIVAWHVRSLAFDFADDAIEDAVELVATTDGERPDLQGFGVGLAQGALRVVREVASDIALASGPALERAAALASIAEAGEVLLDPEVEAVRAGQLLTRGATLGTSGGRRLRGQRLDLKYPWRRPEPAPGLTLPPLVGPGLDELTTAPGNLSLVVAARGCGGSRFLGEFASRADGLTLLVKPWQVGEPLGALREAFCRAESGQVPDLDESSTAALAALLAGRGIDAGTAGQLIGAWLGTQGAVLIDDVGEVDRDTIEAIGCACRSAEVAVVARVLDQSHLPSVFGELPRAGVTILGPLDPEEAAAIVRASAAEKIDEKAVSRWARRGGGRPLAILEAVRFGIESVELVQDRDSMVPRNRVAGRGGPQPARHWMMGRMRFLEDDARAVLDGLLILGGQASVAELERLLQAARNGASLAGWGSKLQQAGWVDVDARGDLCLSSATLRDVLHELLPRERQAEWCALAARQWIDSAQPLAVTRAVLYAFMADDMTLARDAARRAADVARVAGLEATVAALEQLAATGDVSLLMARGLFGGISPRRPTRGSVMPRAMGGQSLHVEGTVGDAGLPGLAAAALRRGDLQVVGELATQLRDESHNEPLAQRLEAMAYLRRGEVTEALRLLRQAKVRARGLDAEERCRAGLAFGVALSSAGRHGDALLEGLEALARAREVGDALGERACARFLAQLSEQAGHHEYARTWRALAE